MAYSILKKTAAAVFAIILAGSAAACGSENAAPGEEELSRSSGASSAESTEPEEEIREEEPEPEPEIAEQPLVIGCADPVGEDCLFFPEGSGDILVQDLTALKLVSFDREGEPVLQGIEGETRSYGGTEYAYESPADLVITENGDGTVYYDFTLRDGLVFSDGKPLTADDVIFTMYVLCDPAYEGESLLGSCPIEGLEEYRKNVKSLLALIPLAGRTNKDYSLWTEEQQTAFWAAVDEGGAAFAGEIVDYLVENGYNTEDDPVSTCAENWGYDLPDNASETDFFLAIGDACGWSIREMNRESAGSALEDLIPGEVLAFSDSMLQIGESEGCISGIQKIDSVNIRITAEKADPFLINQLAFPIAPLHVYGDTEKYDYDSDREAFGFDKGDLSKIRETGYEVPGAGPYIRTSGADGAAELEANPLYFAGEPKIKRVSVQETDPADAAEKIASGEIDIVQAEDTQELEDALRQINGGTFSGKVIHTCFGEDPGYGYIGIHAENVSVGKRAESDASKNLRKAFALLFAAGRADAVDEWFGGRARVIEYPVLGTPFAVPGPGDEEYRTAFSCDAEDKEIFASDMTKEERREAAKEAALGFLEAAGYTVSDGRAVRAPWGAALGYEVLIAGGGEGEHPSFRILTEAAAVLEEIGITLTIVDLEKPEELWARLEEGTAAMWCAAWQTDPDQDMYRIYSVPESGEESAESTLPAYYGIKDSEMDQLILAAENTTDREARKEAYRSLFGILDDWAVEVPVYRTRSAVLFSAERVNTETIPGDLTEYRSWTDEIGSLELNGEPQRTGYEEP